MIKNGTGQSMQEFFTDAKLQSTENKRSLLVKTGKEMYGKSDGRPPPLMDCLTSSPVQSGLIFKSVLCAIDFNFYLSAVF